MLIGNDKKMLDRMVIIAQLFLIVSVAVLLFGCVSTKGEKRSQQGAKDYIFKLDFLDFNEAKNLNQAEDYIKHFNQGNNFLQMMQTEQAISEYNEAIDINQKDDRIYNSRGFAYFSIAQYGQAISNFDKAIEINPRKANAYNNKGIVYMKLGDKEKACHVLKTACELEVCDNYLFAKRRGDCR